MITLNFLIETQALSQSKPIGRRLWCAVGASGLLVAIAAGLVLGLPWYRQIRAITEIERVGGSVSATQVQPEWLIDITGERQLFGGGSGGMFMQGFDRVDIASLTGHGVSNADLEHLKGLPKLRCLWLYQSKVTDAGLSHLNELSELQSLNLSETLVTGVGFVHLHSLTNLRNLNLAWTRFNDANAIHLQKLTSLETLDLSHTQITDVSLLHIRNLTNLKELYLARPDLDEVKFNEKLHLDAGTNEQRQIKGQESTGPHLTDAGLMYLDGLTNLRWLSLINTRVGDEGLRELQRMKNLEILDLAGTNVTDAGLLHLYGLKSLKTVLVWNTQVTAEGANALSLELPNCHVASVIDLMPKP